MPGMTTTASTNLSSYNNRTVEIEVTGVCRQDIMRSSSYTVKVPYNRMSQTMQVINSLGGKITNVTMVSSSPKSKQSSPKSKQSSDSEQ